MKLIKAKIKKKQKPKGEFLAAMNQGTGRIFGKDGDIKKIPFKYGGNG